MFCLGYDFLGDDLACALTPTGIHDISYVELKNGIYDDLYITKDTEFEITPDHSLWSWNFDTILWAKFNDTTNAGNMDWNVEDVSHILLKSRKKGMYKWETLLAHEVNNKKDFNVNYNDYFTGSKEEREYALVPFFYGVEGIYSITEATLSFDDLFLIEGETVWSTTIIDGFCDTTRNIPSSNVELLNNKYPVFVRNTIANYDTGSCKGSFVPTEPDNECNYDYESEGDYRRTKYQKEAMDFLCNSIPKILKLPDGRKWLIQVTPNPTDTAEENYNNRYISFTWVEIGDMDSEEDLYYLGLSDVSPEWWNNY